MLFCVYISSVKLKYKTFEVKIFVSEGLVRMCSSFDTLLTVLIVTEARNIFSISKAPVWTEYWSHTLTCLPPDGLFGSILVKKWLLHISCRWSQSLDYNWLPNVLLHIIDVILITTACLAFTQEFVIYNSNIFNRKKHWPLHWGEREIELLHWRLQYLCSPLFDPKQTFDHYNLINL